MIDRRIQVLRAVAYCGTVTAAAELCNLTPSAASHQIRALAGELGVPLLEHVGRNVQLTPAARTLLGHANELHARWELAQAELVAYRSGEFSGTLRLCGFSTAASTFLPVAAAHLRERYPDLDIRMVEAPPGRAFELLLADRVDICAIVATPDIPPASDENFDQETLYEEPLDLVVPTHHPHASSEAIDLNEAAHDSWIVGTPGSAYHQLILLNCASAGFSPRIAHYSDEWETGAALVSHGFGICLVPRLADIPKHSNITRVPVRGRHTPVRHIIAATRSGGNLQPGIAAGLQALRSAVRKSTSHV